MHEQSLSAPIIDPAERANSADVIRYASPEMLRHIVLDFRQMKSFVNQPLVMDRAEGIWYWDVHGKRYLDGISGIFVVNVGHANPRVLAALHRQLDRLCFAPPLHATNVPAVELAHLIASITPGDLNTVKLFSGGSEATEAAVKLARQYHRQTGNPLKYKVVSLYKGYHGATLGALSATGLPKRKAVFEPTLPGYLHVLPPAYHASCTHDARCPECTLTSVEQFDRVIEMEGPETVAAVIVEPISNTGGITTPAPDYLPRLRAICDRHNVLLIFDEVITGFGRTGQMFAAQTFGVLPDIICLGKGMGSGYGPLAAIVFRDRVAAAFWGDAEEIAFSHGHTFGGNPLSSAAGVAAIREILDRDLCANARYIGDHLRSRIGELADLNVVTDVRGKGLLLGLGLACDAAAGIPFAPELRFGQRVAARALANGLILRADRDWIALAPPLTITREEADVLFDLFAESLRAEVAAVRAGGKG